MSAILGVFGRWAIPFLLLVSPVFVQQAMAAEHRPSESEMAMAREAREKAGIAGVRESLRKALLPLSPAVRKYDELLAGLDLTHISSLATALDEYRKRFASASQGGRDKAFVLFYQVYLDVTRQSYDFVCKGLDEPANHIAEVRKVAEKVGLMVYADSEGGSAFGSKPEFLLSTFKGLVSRDLVEYLKIKAIDLKTGTMCDGELALGIPELGDRCAKWGRFLHRYPRSFIRVVAQAHYDRDLAYLLQGSDYDGPFGKEGALSKSLVKHFSSTYEHIIQAYPEIPLSAFLREYLDVIPKTDMSVREVRDAFFLSHDVLGDRENWAYYAFVDGDSCRSEMPWEEVQRNCLGYCQPGVGVVDTASGRVTRVKYSPDGVPFPGSRCRQEFVLRAAWTDPTFFTVIECDPKSVSNPQEKGGPDAQWGVREFDGQCNLLGTTPVSSTIDEGSFENRYCYEPKKRMLLGDQLFVAGPTPSRTIALMSRASGERATITVYSCEPWAKRPLFSDDYLERAAVSPDMRYVIAVLRSPSEVRLIDTTTGETKRLADVNGRAYERIPVWSPDGKTVAISWPEGNGECAILVYSLDSGELRKVTLDNAKMEGGIASPMFIDSGRLLFSHWRRGKQDVQPSGEHAVNGDPGVTARWVAMDVATCKTLWTIPDAMRYVTVFDSGKRIAAFFPEPKR